MQPVYPATGSTLWGITLDSGTWADWFSGTASALAVFVAVLGGLISLLISRRQKLQAQRGILRETCSAVDQVVAYYRASREITKVLGSQLSFQTLRRIENHLATLVEMLTILSNREEITDGAMFSAITAKHLAANVLRELSDHSENTPNRWAVVHDRLLELSTHADQAADRCRGVRKHAKLKPSKSAESIAAKYDEVVRELVQPTGPNNVPTYSRLTTTKF